MCARYVSTVYFYCAPLSPSLNREKKKCAANQYFTIWLPLSKAKTVQWRESNPSGGRKAFFSDTKSGGNIVHCTTAIVELYAANQCFLLGLFFGKESVFSLLVCSLPRTEFSSLRRPLESCKRVGWGIFFIKNYFVQGQFGFFFTCRVCIVSEVPSGRTSVILIKMR